MDTTKQPGIQIDQIILLEAHFAHNKNALTLPTSTRVNLQFHIQVKVAGKAGGRTAILGVRAETVDQPDNPYNVIAEVAMIVSAIEGEENLDPYEYVNAMGPAAVYPFVREAIASLTMKGRFGALWLKPLNFTAPQVVLAETSPVLAEPAQT